MVVISRRTALQRLALFLAAAVGALIPDLPLSKAAAAAPAPAGPEPPQGFSLLGRGSSLESPDRRRGEFLRPGDAFHRYAELCALPGGEPIGSFVAACTCPAIPAVRGSFAAVALETHTFHLPEGTLIGMGVGATSPGEEAVFAIVGGTGRYAGAGGHYTASQHPVDLGGNGDSEFRFSFVR